MIQTVRNQYEHFPYPPIGSLALPKKDQGTPLSYELGTQLAGTPQSHINKKILVAGAGTLEALVVAQTHPGANEVVAVDFSKPSLKRLKTRSTFAKFFRHDLAPIRRVCVDLNQWEGEKFDYIIASNVLHHNEEPGRLLSRISSWLNPGGIIRIVTYPKSSRIWMRATSKWLSINGLNPWTKNLNQKANKFIQLLPENHPVRNCFESSPEANNKTGLLDSFLHAFENPLSPLEWKEASKSAGLTWVGDTQTETSQSRFLEALIPNTSCLEPWAKLQILDNLLEICANPILWFVKTGNAIQTEPEISKPLEIPNPLEIFNQSPNILSQDFEKEFYLPSMIHHELGNNLRQAEKLLAKAGVSLEETLKTLKVKVGARVSIKGKKLAGLSITDYKQSDLLNAPQPWDKSDWIKLENSIDAQCKLSLVRKNSSERTVPGKSLAEQAELIQILMGANHSRIGPVRLIKS